MNEIRDRVDGRVLSLRWPSAALWSGILIIAIVLLATWTRFHLLGAQSLWHDEGNSYVQATRSFSAIADNAARDIHPPGYYWLLAVWRGLVGETEFALRSLSAFASVLSVAFTYALGRRLFGRLAGLSAAVFVTLNTFNIFYAQEARMYALLALWGVASMWALVGFIEASQKRQADSLRMWAGALALFNAAGLWTQYAFPLVILAQGLLFGLWFAAELVKCRHEASGCVPTWRALGYYLAANVLTLILYAPWLPMAWSRVTTWPNTGQDVAPAEAISAILGYLAFGITTGGGATITVVFFALFALLILPEARGERIWWRVLVPVLWVVVSVGGFLALGLFREANLKLLLPAQIGFALWMGRGVDVLWSVKPRRESQLVRMVPPAAAVVAMVVLLSGLWSGLDPLYHDPAYQRDDYRAIAAAIRAGAAPGDAVILDAPNQQEVFSYYDTGDVPVYPLPRGLGGDDAATLAETRAIIERHDQIFAVLWGVRERDPNNIVENTLDAEAFEAGSAWYGDVRLVRYAAPVEFETLQESGAQFGDSIVLERYAVSAATVQPGDVVQVRLEWSAEGPLEQRYKVFAHLLDHDGVLVAQHDGEPTGGRAPTTEWQPGDVIIDNHALVVPHDLSPAHYSLIIGLYNPDNPLERLPVRVAANGELQDHLTLETITAQQEDSR